LTGGYPRPVLSLALAAVIATSSPITDAPNSVPAAFALRSYAPGEQARLTVWKAPDGLSIQLFRAGPEKTRSLHDDVMRGVPVTKRTSAHVVEGAVDVRAPTGPSGLYFAKLTAPNGDVGYAPFVLRPRVPGVVRVLVVLPTNTWEAYNLRDVDGNGVGDTWYADSSIPSVDITRPFLDNGVPPHFREYDQGFLRWIAETHRRPEFISDDDLERMSGTRLAKLYDLIVFSGHEEYVTPHVYRAISRFRNLGGNLAFLSANNFFYVVHRRGRRIFRTGRYRDIGMDSARITGARYVGWFEGKYPTRPYTAVGTKLAPWLFAGTGLHDGSTFGNYGIEIDARGLGSPRGTLVLARIPDEFGPGRPAEMTYYETKRGAKVFDAGAINFGGTAEWPVVSRMLDNLWARLSKP
jgi:hypothetical protein